MRAFLLPADTPLFSEQSLFRMSGFMDGSACDILQPLYKGNFGHPVLISCSAIPELICYEGPDGLKGAISVYPGPKAATELDDIGLTIDADRPEDYDKLNSYIKSEIVKTPLSCLVEISVQRKEPFFSGELFELLRLVEKNSSLHKACEEMGMAYTKGWRLVKIAEHQLGFLLLECRVGGSSGGGSTLTQACGVFLQRYGGLCADASEYAQHAFNTYFKEYIRDAEEITAGK
jgi:molybdate transport repressor ModE-like protein